jgi:hypothetical protein
MKQCFWNEVEISGNRFIAIHMQFLSSPETARPSTEPRKYILTEVIEIAVMDGKCPIKD